MRRRELQIDDGVVALAALASLAVATAKGHSRAMPLAERALAHAERLLASAESDLAAELAAQTEAEPAPAEKDFG